MDYRAADHEVLQPWVLSKHDTRPEPCPEPDLIPELISQFHTYDLTLHIRRLTLVLAGFGAVGTCDALQVALPARLQPLRVPLVGAFAAQDSLIAERTLEAGTPYVMDIDDAEIYRRAVD